MSYYYYEKHLPAVVMERLSASARLEAEARRAVVREFSHLIADGSHFRPRWGYTVRDVMEAVRMVYDSQCMFKDDCEPCSFAELAECACKRLGLRVPRNPRSCAQRAAQRKGIKRLSLMKRYEVMILNGV